MPRNEYQCTHRDGSKAAEVARTDRKTAEQTPQARLPSLLLHTVNPLPHTGELRHLRFVVLPEEVQ
jgi:hypothetical protein